MSDRSLDQLIVDAVSSAIDANIERFAQLQLDRERYLGIPQVAELAHVSRPTVRGWVALDHKPLPAYRVGRDYRIKMKDFETWFEQYRTGP